jgi:hypothetical protein
MALCLVLAFATSSACGSGLGQTPDSGSNGVYDCTVVQVRAGSCAEPRPACTFLDGGFGGMGDQFEIQITGDHFDWLGCPAFACDGVWSDGGFTCTLPDGSTAVTGTSCGEQPWTLLQQDPEAPGRGLMPGETLYAGIPVDNAFNAHCRPQ